MNKKAISEIVGYSILIVIAVSLSVLVYSFLRLYIPKDRVTCEEDVKLTIQYYACNLSKGVLNLTITNKGLFKADTAYIRFGNEDQKIKTRIDNLSLSGELSGLDPTKSFSSTYNVSGFMISGHHDYGLELQPAIIVDKQIIVCENAIITQPIQCG